jgi:hypothetical protein
MQPREGQRILAICGSGDQAFALAGHGATVIAYDINAKQIALAEHRRKLLQNKKQRQFLEKPKYSLCDTPEWERRNTYFRSSPSLLQKVAKRASHVSFTHGDIFSYNGASVDGVYLSNAWTSPEQLVGLLSHVACNGVIYGARVQYEKFFRLVSGVCIERRSTEEARMQELFWSPVIGVRNAEQPSCK